MKTESGDDRTKASNEEEQEGEELRRGPWTLDEDNLLIQCVACHGEGRWNVLAKSAGLRRTGKSCRLRWLNYLKPDIKRGNLTPQEQLLILELHSKWGNRWSKIAGYLPGRTDNEIKNYWRTRVQKQARQLNMESNSPSFVDAIRCFYMPRLVQKIEQSSTSSTTLNFECSPASTASQMDMEWSQNKMVDVNIDSALDTSCSNISLSDISELSEIPSSASSAYGKNEHSQGSSSLVVDDCYYDMDMASMSAAEMPFTNSHVSGHGWPGDNLVEDSVWDLDELWQFRK